MDHLQKFVLALKLSITASLLITSFTTVTGWLLLSHYVWSGNPYPQTIPHIVSAILAIILPACLITPFITARILQPVRFIWEAVLHIAPDTANVPAPDPQKIRLGREFVTVLTSHVYKLASIVEDVERTADKAAHDLKAEFVANSIPLPLVVMDKNATIVFANKSLLTYIGREETDVSGQNIYSVLDLLFNSNNTLDAWLEQARANKVTDTKTWQRVRLNTANQQPSHYFDLVAYYNKSNTEGFEIMLVLFDRTHEYMQDDQAMSFVAVAAHELRTPLTLLRGYIDAFEEELDGKLSAEMTDFMHKMKAAAQQLAAFTTTILDVSRFENNQLVLTLHEEQLAPILQQAINNMELRAQVRGIKLTLQVNNSLPTIGADAVSINEVMSNLLDNAIKYSGKGTEIIIHSYLTTNGLVETTVQDFGLGIPETAVGNIFEKFYRDYHHRNQVGGSGMGLYLSKAIIDAHGGNIWVRTHEGQGSTFGFTLQPYAQLAADTKKDDNKDITRTAHGWIKNHSLYRQ